jgi:hypothetical protein
MGAFVSKHWAVLLLALSVSACGKAMLPMEPGVPLEIHRGYCFVDTTYSQRGKTRNRDDVMKRLSRYPESRPHLVTGNALAIGSVGAWLATSAGLITWDLADGGLIKMSDGDKTALLATTLGVGVLGIVLCLTSDGQYNTAAELYNAHHTANTPPTNDDEEGDPNDDAANAPP